MEFTKIRNVKTPTRGTSKSSGIDFYIPEDFKTTRLLKFEDVLIPSGIKLKIPENRTLIAFNKSGRATKNKLIVGACVIDEDYQGELHFHLFNLSQNEVIIYPGDKIIQFLLLPIDYCEMKEVSTEEELFKNIKTQRGEGGFGSTNNI